MESDDTDSKEGETKKILVMNWQATIQGRRFDLEHEEPRKLVSINEDELTAPLLLQALRRVEKAQQELTEAVIELNYLYKYILLKQGDIVK